MTYFQSYLEEAKKAVEEKYNVTVILYLGEYTPDIDNFMFHYYFVTVAEPTVVAPVYKVTVNTWNNGQQYKLLVRKWPNQPNACLKAIDQPVNLSLTEAYDTALLDRYKPILNGAVVFLENSTQLKLGPGYWFMNELNDTQWIFVSLKTRKVTLTELTPCTF